MKTKIDMEEIPNEEIVTDSNYKNLYWYPKMVHSQWQLKDEKYTLIKDFLIDFYTTQPKDKSLYWGKKGTEEGDSPITIHSLGFVKGSCRGCGILFEEPCFYGDILINEQKYDYDGEISGIRWCECIDTRRQPDEDIEEYIALEEYFLFKFNIIDGPFMFYHVYLKLDDLWI